MSIDEKIRKLQQELNRVRICHPSRLPSWVAAAALAAGLSVSTGACTTERHAEEPSGNPADMQPNNMGPGPVAPLYAGPAPQPMEAVPDPAPAYAGPPPDAGTTLDEPDARDVPPVPAYDGPPMRRTISPPPPPVPAYGVPMPQPVPTPPAPPMKSDMKSDMDADPMKPTMRVSEPVTDYGGPFL